MAKQKETSPPISPFVVGQRVAWKAAKGSAYGEITELFDASYEVPSVSRGNAPSEEEQTVERGADGHISQLSRPFRFFSPQGQSTKIVHGTPAHPYLSASLAPSRASLSSCRLFRPSSPHLAMSPCPSTCARLTTNAVVRNEKTGTEICRKDSSISPA